MNIELQGYENKTLTLTLYDATGRLIRTEQINNTQAKLVEQWQIGHLQSGVYSLKVNDGQKLSVRQVVKQ